MTTEQLEKEPANMDAVVKRIRTASPNTVISGSIGGAIDSQPIAATGDTSASKAAGEPQ